MLLRPALLNHSCWDVTSEETNCRQPPVGAEDSVTGLLVSMIRDPMVDSRYSMQSVQELRP